LELKGGQAEDFLFNHVSLQRMKDEFLIPSPLTGEGQGEGEID
jgi:hypothetical protein